MCPAYGKGLGPASRASLESWGLGHGNQAEDFQEAPRSRRPLTHLLPPGHTAFGGQVLEASGLLHQILGGAELMGIFKHTSAVPERRAGKKGARVGSEAEEERPCRSQGPVYGGTWPKEP